MSPLPTSRTIASCLCAALFAGYAPNPVSAEMGGSRRRTRYSHGVPHQVGDRRRQRLAERQLVGPGAHLSPGLSEDINEFLPWISGMPGGKDADLVLKEHEARSVLKRLGPRVGPEAGLRHPNRSIGRLTVGHPGRQKQLPGALGLTVVQRFAPGEITNLALGIGSARNRPSLQMLTARGE